MIKKCLFPVAGYGTRFLPATKAMPKEMLPILNKPLVQYGVEEAVEASLTDIGFVTGRGKRAIEDHFDVSYELEQSIKGTEREKYLESTRALIESSSFSYTRQREIRGVGHANLTGRTLVGDAVQGFVEATQYCYERFYLSGDHACVSEPTVETPILRSPSENQLELGT